MKTTIIALLLLFCPTLFSQPFTFSDQAFMGRVAAGSATLTESFDTWQYGTLVTSDIIDGTDCWHYGINQLNGNLIP
jgi:hypothetical protein